MNGKPLNYYYTNRSVIARIHICFIPLVTRIFISCYRIVLLLAVLFHHNYQYSQYVLNCFDISLISVGNNHCNEQYIRTKAGHIIYNTPNPMQRISLTPNKAHHHKNIGMFMIIQAYTFQRVPISDFGWDVGCKNEREG